MEQAHSLTPGSGTLQRCVRCSVGVGETPGPRLPPHWPSPLPPSGSTLPHTVHGAGWAWSVESSRRYRDRLLGWRRRRRSLVSGRSSCSMGTAPTIVRRCCRESRAALPRVLRHGYVSKIKSLPVQLRAPNGLRSHASGEREAAPGASTPHPLQCPCAGLAMCCAAGQRAIHLRATVSVRSLPSFDIDFSNTGQALRFATRALRLRSKRHSGFGNAVEALCR